jgi:hypothetical protein
MRHLRVQKVMANLRRVVAAFIIAPMTAPLLAIAENYVSQDVVFHQFILVIGVTVGYGCAIIVGLPAYFLYFRNLQPMRFGPFLGFTAICTAGYFGLMGVVMVSQDGLLALLSATYLGYGLIFFVFTGLSVAVFYLIAFHSFRSAGKTDR